MPVVESSKDARERADVRFKKTQKADAARNAALADHASEERQRKVKTAKLRELRLARDAELEAAAAANPPPAKKPRKSPAKA